MWDLTKGSYKIAVGHWKIAPAEFWGMTLEEFWWLQEDQAAQMRAQSGALSRAELDELDEWFELNKVKYERK